jgi:hypothetical protein
VRDAAGKRLREWAAWASSIPEKDRAWFAEVAHQAYVIETTCRGLHTAETGTVTTKAQAVAWAIDSVPEEYRALILWSQDHREDDKTNAGLLPDVVAFIQWAANQKSLPNA